jgi:hypothetical protein
MGSRKCMAPIAPSQAGLLSMGEQTAVDSVIISEAQLLLAEKRTSLAAMRTGTAIFALPLCVLTALIGILKYSPFPL